MRKYLVAAVLLPLLVAPGEAAAMTNTTAPKAGCTSLSPKDCARKRARIHRIYPWCNTWKCVKRTKRIQARRLALQRKREWRYWTSRYIPPCTWRGESGTALAEFHPNRYIMRHGGSLGPPIEGVAYGKFQFMPSTYRRVAKYGDWSRLDQEIAARRLFWQQGTSPWQAC